MIFAISARRNALPPAGLALLVVGLLVLAIGAFFGAIRPRMQRTTTGSGDHALDAGERGHAPANLYLQQPMCRTT